MAFQAESPMKSLLARPIEAWVWPLTAAIVLGGSILFWSFAGLFWLATHPTQKSVVIWMATPEPVSSQFETVIGSHNTIAAEDRRDANAN